MYEYYELAKYYDLFYKNKNYDKEVQFLIQIIGKRKTILDVGCDTGIHMKLLADRGYVVSGLDKSLEMLSIAKERLGDGYHLYNDDILKFKSSIKYDAIISMFAVFNHLNGIDEFEKGIVHLYQYLNDGGVMIIDLHNGKSNGRKLEEIDGKTREMIWTYDDCCNLENTKIVYHIDGREYIDNHIFYIYKLLDIKKILEKLGLKYELLENYSSNLASDKSKNILVIIRK